MFTIAHGRLFACSIALLAAAAAVQPGYAEQSPVRVVQKAVSAGAFSIASVERPRMAARPAPQAPAGVTAPARFFTINEVMAKRGQPAVSPDVHLAAVNPTQPLSDAALPSIPPVRGDEPFGLFTFRAPDGQLWSKWRKVEEEIAAEAPALSRCEANSARCTPAAARFAAVVKAAAEKQGRARLEEVNRRVNAAIRYASDIAQWGEPDRWSAPLDVSGKGSFETGHGDCEDYAIAKYVALRAAGVATKDLRVLLVRDKVVNMGHAVLAARLRGADDAAVAAQAGDEGRWLIMDNRFDRLLAEGDADFLLPLFAMDADGVKLFAAPYARRSSGSQDMVSGSDVAPASVPPGAGGDPAGGGSSLPYLL